MTARSGGLAGGAISFFRKKTALVTYNGTAHGAGVHNHAGSEPLPGLPSDPVPLPSAEQGQISCEPSSQAFSYVGKGCRIVGQAFYQSSIRIDGQVDGIIGANDVIIVGQSGTITTTSPIKAEEVIIEGTVSGNVVASKRIEIRASADVTGHLSAPIIAIEAGAAVEGCCSTASRQKGLGRLTDQDIV